MYDIIGDIHGYADALVRLLEKLGYRQQAGVYRHAQRQAVFVGDFIDRGPEIPRTIQVVRAMVEAGSALAVMGNHEFNALVFHTRRPDAADSGATDTWVRSHSPAKVRQHAATLEQFGSTPERCSPELRDALDWFRTLPMWLDLGGLRVVHACWDAEQIAVLQEKQSQHGGITDDFLIEAGTEGTPLFEAVEDVLKGKEIRLPADEYYVDHEGHTRSQVRIQWFRPPVDETYHSYALPPGSPERPYSTRSILADGGVLTRPYPPEDPPVFFGHYWLHGPRPRLLAANVCCVDYSVARGGYLCAYSWHGEQSLVDEHFTWVPAVWNEAVG